MNLWHASLHLSGHPCRVVRCGGLCSVHDEWSLFVTCSVAWHDSPNKYCTSTSTSTSSCFVMLTCNYLIKIIVHSWEEEC
jgi:hypothetical protein